LLKSTKYLAI